MQQVKISQREHTAEDTIADQPVRSSNGCRVVVNDN